MDLPTTADQRCASIIEEMTMKRTAYEQLQDLNTALTALTDPEGCCRVYRQGQKETSYRHPTMIPSIPLPPTRKLTTRTRIQLIVRGRNHPTITVISLMLFCWKYMSHKFSKSKTSAFQRMEVRLVPCQIRVQPGEKCLGHIRDQTEFNTSEL